MKAARKNSLFGQQRHGLSRTPEYRAWQQIRLRCLDPKHAAYPGYGGRGITIDPHWIDDPAAFIAHIGKRPSPAHELDRKDNDKGYEPGNLRWVTRTVNSRNRRNNRNVTYRGETMPVSAWCERLGLPKDTIFHRLTSGATIEQALETPIRPKAPNGTPARLSNPQVEALGLLRHGPQRTTARACQGFIAGPVASALIKKGLARRENGRLAITPAGETAYARAMETA